MFRIAFSVSALICPITAVDGCVENYPAPATEAACRQSADRCRYFWPPSDRANPQFPLPVT